MRRDAMRDNPSWRFLFKNNYRSLKTLTKGGKIMGTIYAIYRITHTDNNDMLFHEELVDTYYDESVAEAVWRYLETTNETPHTWYELCEEQEPDLDAISGP